MPIALAHRGLRRPDAPPGRAQTATYLLAELLEYLRYSASRWERHTLTRLTRHESHVLYVLARHELRHDAPLSYHTLHKATGLRHEAVSRAVEGLQRRELVDCWQDDEHRNWARITPLYLKELLASAEVQFELDELRNTARTLDRLVAEAAPILLTPAAILGAAVVAEVAARASLEVAEDALADRVEADRAEAEEAQPPESRFGTTPATGA